MELIQTFASCQRKSHTADYSDAMDMIVYASHNMVALYNPFDEQNTPRHILRGHKDRVQCVKWIKSSNCDGIFVSSSADKTLKIWNYASKDDQTECVQTLDGHDESVCTVGTLGATDKFPHDLVVSGCCDGKLRVFMRNVGHETFSLIQTFDLDGKFPLDIAISLLPQSQHPVMVVGGTDKNIRVYTMSGNLKFVMNTMLSGHLDWVTCVDFVLLPEGDLLLASGSQDKCIRLWRLSPKAKDEVEEEFEITQTKANEFSTEAGDFSFTLDSVLLGHDDWVQSVMWSPEGEFPKLLSSSADKSMIIWAQDGESGVWINDLHVGDMGGTSQGIFGAVWASRGKSIVGCGYYGDFSVWYKDSSEDWKSKPGLTGHFNTVMDMRWDPSYTYLMSVSHDQTTRVLAECFDPDGVKSWHEIARPQVHGYDIQTLAFVNPFEFVSGAEGEKVIRMFQAPKTFVKSLKALSRRADDEKLKKVDIDRLPLVAALPALGLSNKAVDEAEDAKEILKISASIEPLIAPPLPSDLHHFSLWPEHDKLYGHGDSLYSLECSHDGRTMVSASVGRVGGRLEDTSLRIWETDETIGRFKESQKPLQCHSLTVTDIKFSWSGEYFATAGRDRQWTLCRRNAGDGKFSVVYQRAKAHARIIWGISWTFDDKFVVTGSRDKTVAVWDALSATPKRVAVVSFDHAVTSVECLPVKHIKYQYVIGVGFESGDLAIVCSNDGLNWTVLAEESSSRAHAGAVKRFRWRVVVPGNSNDDALDNERTFKSFESTCEIVYQFATCSEDFSVRIWNLSQ